MPEPETTYVPYQAYKSKRHSRNASNPNTRLSPPESPAPPSRSDSVISIPSSPPQTSNGYVLSEKEPQATFAFTEAKSSQLPPSIPVIILDPSPPSSSNGPPSPLDSTDSHEPPESPVTVSHPPINGASRLVNGGHSSESDAPPSAASSFSASTSAASSSASPLPQDPPPPLRPRKTSTFRHIPLRNARSPLPSSPLAQSHSRNATVSSQATPNYRDNLTPSEQPQPQPQSYRVYTQPQQRPSSAIMNSRPSSAIIDPHTQIPSDAGTERALPAIPAFLADEKHNRRHSTPPGSLTHVASPLARSSSLVPPRPSPSSHFSSPSALSASFSSPSPTPSPAPIHQPTPHAPHSISASTSSTSQHPSHHANINPTSTSTPPPPRPPYRPGFQPKGVWRPRTDEFTALRTERHLSGSRAAERTKLERRLEKLISLHFPVEDEKGKRPSLSVASGANSNRRASSFFDFDFKSMVGIGVAGRDDIRVAEQRITPWQEDSSVNKCPLCAASFHPLTNRKHHCRLCGQIICALPIKRPQRPELCSVLFVVDPKTQKIDEVGEGVDYGVRRKTRRGASGSVDVGRGVGAGGADGQQDEEEDQDKFLKGVRICKECRPVLLRQQYRQEVVHVPTFVKLYDAFIALEKEIEDALPQFQELILNLSHDSQPTKEASAARKRLLEAFAQYDSLAKRIRQLTCPDGPGSSQDRVQMAVLSRANLFLQKNMFPLQSLPKRSTPSSSKSPTPPEDADGREIDPSSATALALQPLLEQEALLEGFVEEAKAQRKFEDAKSLRVNLSEIREEIERILNAEGVKGAGTRKRKGKGR